MYKNLIQIAFRALFLYFITTFSAVVLGLILVATIRPGYLNTHSNPTNPTILDNRKINTADTILDLIRNLIPDNMIEMMFQLEETTLTPKYKLIEVYNNNSSLNISDIDATNFTASDANFDFSLDF